MISQTAEYALRAVVCMAEYADAPHTVHAIARNTQVPTGYLSKVLQSLSRAGLVTSQRGLGGGFMLAKSPRELTIYEIIQAVDPVQRIRTCPLKLTTHGVNLCPLHRHLDNAMALVEQSFRATTVAELLDESGSSKPLCDVPATDKQTAAVPVRLQPVEIQHDRDDSRRN